MKEAIRESKAGGEPLLHAWEGTSVGNVDQPARGARGSRSCSASASCSRSATGRRTWPRSSAALSAKTLSAARHTPLIGAYARSSSRHHGDPRARAMIVTRGSARTSRTWTYETAVPLLINKYLRTACWGSRSRPDRSLHGPRRPPTCRRSPRSSPRPLGAVRAVGPRVRTQRARRPDRDGRGRPHRHRDSADRVGYTNIMDYVQLLFSFFSTPLFATFIIGMFEEADVASAGSWGWWPGRFGAAAAHFAHAWEIVDLGSAQARGLQAPRRPSSPTRSSRAGATTTTCASAASPRSAASSSASARR